MKILAIETSCDETAVAVLDGRNILSSSIASSMKLHEATGGIIPEQAARKQVEYMIPVLNEALALAYPSLSTHDAIALQIDAIAVTVGPGLIGSLLVGVETAKTLSVVFNKPLIPVNHVRAHLYANWIGTNPQFPAVGLVVSGGHTDLVYMKSHSEIELIGATRDDAAGEAFDKCARLIGLGYPGGPAISTAAEAYRSKHSNQTYILFPRGMAHEDTLDYSFSGLKTAVARFMAKNPDADQARIATEIEEAIVDALLIKVTKAISQYNPVSFLLSGGVSANSHLRQKVLSLFSEKYSKLQAYVPEKSWSTDNAAMIALFASVHSGSSPVFSVAPVPSLSVIQ